MNTLDEQQRSVRRAPARRHTLPAYVRGLPATTWRAALRHSVPPSPGRT